ncbi:NETR-like protein, partial [Mya arenaria]
MAVCYMILNLICVFCTFCNFVVSEESQFFLFEFDQVCQDTVYGDVLANLTDVNNVQCGVRCADDVKCKSYTFDPLTEVCIMNNDTVNTTTIGPCSTFVRYAAKRGWARCVPGSACTRPIRGVRLCDGGGLGVCNATSGRVEVLMNGQWGTVCDDFWNDPSYYNPEDPYYYGNMGFNNAHVLCTSLGYTTGLPMPDGYYGEGLDPTWLDNVSCEGWEEHLFQCVASPVGVQNCDHSEDVGVEC